MSEVPLTTSYKGRFDIRSATPLETTVGLISLGLPYEQFETL